MPEPETTATLLARVREDYRESHGGAAPPSEDALLVWLIQRTESAERLLSGQEAVAVEDLRGPQDCPHEFFFTTVKVGRLTEDDGEVHSFVAELHIQCTQCRQPFKFLGLPSGFHVRGACTSTNGQEARLALAPTVGLLPAPPKAQGFTGPRLADNPPIRVRYTNYKGTTAVRTVVPQGVRYGSNEWHPEPQWLMDVWDVDKQAQRTFAMRDMVFEPR